MNNNTFIKLVIFLILTFLFTGCSTSNKNKLSITDYNVIKSPGLSFPYKDGNQVDYFYCFGLNPWSAETKEIHGGIDIIPKYTPGPQIKKYQMVATADCKLAFYNEGLSGDDYMTFLLVMEINPYWYLIYNFESQNSDQTIIDLQRKSVISEKGTFVKKGENIGNLIVSGSFDNTYPHLHYALMYKNPANSLESLLGSYLKIIVNDGTNIPSFYGSPWNPKDLKRPTTFFCPAVFSDPEARKIFRKKAIDTRGNRCFSVCAYNSVNGDCGRYGGLPIHK